MGYFICIFYVYKVIFYSNNLIFSGHVAERTSLRFFLGFGLIGSGFINMIFGIAKYVNIHSVYYFYSIQVFKI